MNFNSNRRISRISRKGYTLHSPDHKMLWLRLHFARSLINPFGILDLCYNFRPMTMLILAVGV